LIGYWGKMIDPWQDWNDNPPPVLTCQIREGCTGSVELVVITKNGNIYDNVFRGNDGLCHCYEGGRISNIDKWIYAPGAWNNIVVDVAAVEISMIKRLQAAGALPLGDPERITNDLADPPCEGFLSTLDEMRNDEANT